MDKDKVVTEDNYKQVVLKRMITLCWVLLGICFVVKIFGGNFFAFVGDSEVVRYIESNYVLLTIVQFVFYFAQSYLYLTSVIKGKTVLKIVVTVLLFTLKALLIIDEVFITISMIAETLILIFLPIIFKCKWYNSIIMYLLLMLFQLISLFTKNIGIISFPDTTLVGYVYMIDYYIMLLLTMLYSRKGDINFMRLGFLFLSNDTTQLEAYKEVLKTKYEKKVAKVDARIEKINKKK